MPWLYIKRWFPRFNNTQLKPMIRSFLEHVLGATSQLAVSTLQIIFEVLSFWMHKGINKTIGNTILIHDLEHAKSYKLWLQTASKLEQTSKKGTKAKPNSLLQTKYTQLKRALQEKNISRLLILIEECCMRNFGDILNPSFYEPYGFPQEPLIERFLALLEAAIKWVAACECIPKEEKCSFFKALQSRLGNSALMLSGGSSLGMLHIGVAKGLLDSSILPTIIHGSSAGSIVAAIICVSLKLKRP